LVLGGEGGFLGQSFGELGATTAGVVKVEKEVVEDGELVVGEAFALADLLV
jgi:hypothetical protein